MEKGQNKFGLHLLHVKGKEKLYINEVTPHCDQLNHGDAFILYHDEDKYSSIYVWLGKESGNSERLKASYTAETIKHLKKGSPHIVRIENGDDDQGFWDLIGGKATIKTSKEGGEDKEVKGTAQHLLFRMNEQQNGKFKFTRDAIGEISFKSFNSHDVFFVDCGDMLFCWLGKEASQNSKTKAMTYAQNYLGFGGRPLWIPIIKLEEGKESHDFWILIKK